MCFTRILCDKNLFCLRRAIEPENTFLVFVCVCLIGAAYCELSGVVVRTDADFG